MSSNPCFILFMTAWCLHTEHITSPEVHLVYFIRDLNTHRAVTKWLHDPCYLSLMLKCRSHFIISYHSVCSNCVRRHQGWSDLLLATSCHRSSQRTGLFSLPWFSSLSLLRVRSKFGVGVAVSLGGTRPVGRKRDSCRERVARTKDIRVQHEP